jgi:hypothetical protein
MTGEKFSWGTSESARRDKATRAWSEANTRVAHGEDPIILLQQTKLTLCRGQIVRALKILDPEGAKVQTGDIGVVFEEADYYGDSCGPMVQWLVGYQKTIMGGGRCSVYPGDVEIAFGCH